MFNLGVVSVSPRGPFQSGSTSTPRGSGERNQKRRGDTKWSEQPKQCGFFHGETHGLVAMASKERRKRFPTARNFKETMLAE